jgi:hypothetical protein
MSAGDVTPGGDEPQPAAPGPAPGPGTTPAEPVRAPGATPPRPTITVPKFPVRDPNDPLDPQRLAAHELTVRQAIQQARRLIRTVRPSFYAEYPGLLEQLRDLAENYSHFLAWAEFDYQRADLYLKDLKSVSPEGIEGVKALDAARKGLGDAWLTWRSVYATYRELSDCFQTLSRRKTSPFPDAKKPPDAPPSLA